MADLASTMSSFLFPEGFQPLDGCDEEELNAAQAFLKASLLPCNVGIEDGNPVCELITPSVNFQEPVGRDAVPDVGHEVAIQLEQEASPSTPNKPPVHLTCLSPLTPTANLKVLISAASPEIRVLDSRRQLALFSAIADHASSLQAQVIDVGMEEGVLEEVVEIECMSQGEDGTEEGDKPINRKSKSLGLLCQRFLSRYPDYPENGVAMAISLDAISKDLGVERRRIYDIVNVLESIEMVSRVAKNKYLWHGKMNMESTLARLKCLGEKKRYADQIVHLKKLQIQNEYSDELEQLSKQPFRDISNIGAQIYDLYDKKEMDKFDEDTNSRRDKSLGVMSQKFIMLFLVSEAKVITLDIAARVLIGDINYEIREGAKFKTKVRRLYDIANILTSLEMIKKVHVQEGRGRKPAFRWTGPNPDTCDVDPSDVRVENDAPSRQSFFSTPAAPLPTTSPQDAKPSPTSHLKGPKKAAWSRHASFNAICEVVARERRSYSSAPNSPTKDSQAGKPDTPIDEKFRQDFEALRSKYPDQMSKIYVTEKQELAGQEDSVAPDGACPSAAVPVSSPRCTPGNTAGVTPANPKVIVSPIPGSLPVSTSQLVSSAIQVPLSFSVIQSDGSVAGSQEAIPNPGRATVPASWEAKSAPDGPTTAAASGQYSLLTNTVNALHMVLRQPDTMRRSKRTIKQPMSGEFEYQPVVKRSKVELDAASALQRGSRDLANQIQPGLTQYLKIPVDGKLLQQPAGRPVQTIIIKRDVSVLNKSSSVPTAGHDTAAGGDANGHPWGTVTATLMPSGILRQQRLAQQQAIFINHAGTAPAKTVTLKQLAPCGTPVVETATQELQTEHSPELAGKESLDDIDEITANAQLLFHEAVREQTFHCLGQGEKQGSQQRHVTKQFDKTGLGLDKSKDTHRQTGIQRDTQTKATNTRIKNGRSPWQHFRQKPVKICKRPSAARALHLCPEFRNAKVALPRRQDSPGTVGESTSSVPERLQYAVTSHKYNGVANSGRVLGDGSSALVRLATPASEGSEYGKDRKTGNGGIWREGNGVASIDDEDETLAWPLHNPSVKPIIREAAPATSVASRPEQPPLSRPWLPRANSKSCLSLPCSPFPSGSPNGSSNPSPITICDRPRSLSSLGASETTEWLSGRFLGVRGGNPPVSALLACGFRDRCHPLRAQVVMPYAACFSPIRGRQLLFGQDQQAHFPPPRPLCGMSGLYNLSNSPLPLVGGGESRPRVSSPSQSRDYPAMISFPSATSNRPVRPRTPVSAAHPGQYPHTSGVSRPSLSRVTPSPFAGSSFRPVSRSSDPCLPLQPDECLTSPILSQSRDPSALSPQTSPPSFSISGASPCVGYPCSQSTPVAGNQLLPQSPVVPAVLATSIPLQSRRLQHISSSPRPYTRIPATMSGNGLVYISSPSILSSITN